MSAYARIDGTGSYLPERIVHNDELAEKVDTSDSWIRERTGIVQRHIAAEGETTVDMAEQAARRALEAAGLPPESLDMIILATTSADQIFPASACMLQARLGAFGAAAFDLQAVCAGFIYALSCADNFIRAGSARHVLVIGSETFSRLIDWNDRGTCVLFGDGAGAVVVSRSEQPGILSTDLHADGRMVEHLQVPCGVSHRPEVMRAGQAFVSMNGREVFKFAVSALADTAERTLARHDMQGSDIDWLIPHQANIRIISSTARKLGLPMNKVVVTVDHHGNTSAASIPLALDEAVRDGRVQRGQTLLLEGIGGGFAWGSALLRY